MTDTTADKIFKRLNEVDRNINKRIDDSNKEVNALTVEVAKVNVKLDSKVDELFVVKEIQAHAEKQPKTETKKSVIDWPKSIRSAMFIFAGGGGISVAVKTIIENV